MSLKSQEVHMNSSDFVPRKETVLVKYQELEHTKEVKTAGGIIIQQEQRSSLERTTFGEVLAVGAELSWVNPKDVVVWANTDGINLKFNDGEFILLREHSILGKKS